jgi:hypothetical protein
LVQWNNRASYLESDGHVDVCAVLCLDCEQNQDKIARYRSIGRTRAIGRFLLFLD